MEYMIYLVRKFLPELEFDEAERRLEASGYK
jgi:hypothetical protein